MAAVRRSTPSSRALLALLLLAALAALLTAFPGSAAARGSVRIGLSENRALVGPAKRACADGRRLERRARASVRRRAASCKREAAAIASGVPSSLYWGAWIGNQHTGTEAPWDMNATADFEAETGKQLSLIQFSSPFADCSHSPCSNYSFPAKPMQSIREHGAIPFFSWSSQSTPSSLSEPDYQLSDVISGRYDSYIRSFATAAASWGHPFFLRFNWEMNGDWFPWAEGVNGNAAGEYVQAWRHVHDIFTSVGATNATWVWCPNVDPRGEFKDVGSFYPGAEYVDWTCLDGYNWGGSEWIPFDKLYGPTYHRIVDQVAPGKPMVIAEVGCSEHGGSKAAWISAMLAQLPTRFPRVHGVMWFDKFEDNDWPLETSASAEAAFASGIQSPSYLTNGFGSLPSGTIPAPS